MKTLFFLILYYSILNIQVNVENVNQEVNKRAEFFIVKSNRMIYTNPEQAVYYAKKAIQVLPDNENKNDYRAEALLVYSLAEKFLGNFDSSIKLLFEALEYVTPNNLKLKGQIYSLMGTVYCSLTDYDAAINYNDKATALLKTVSDSAAIAACYNSRGIIYYSLGEYSIAEKFLKKSLRINQSLGLKKEQASNLNNLALYKGNCNKKIELLKDAILINKSLNAKWSLGENFNNLGKQYYYNKQYELALDALAKAKNIATMIGAKELLMDNLQYSSWIYAAMGNYNKAYESLKRLNTQRSKLYNSNNLRSLEHDFINKKLLNQKRDAEKRKYEYELKVLKLNIYILISIFLFLVIIILFLVKWYRKKKQLELIKARYLLEQYERKVAELKFKQQNLELKNTYNALVNQRKEVTIFAIFLQSRNELLNKIREMIKRGFSMNHNEVLEHLKKISLFIAQYQSTVADNNSVLNNVRERNKEFIKRLTNKHPNLTQNQIKLSLLLCVKFSTKEISLLTGKKNKAINMSRYRLRKSLNLSQNDSLTDYLQSI